MEAADLVVINTCAIREGAEQKVIGRQGHLARLKAANPGMRVVLTGCSVREPDRDGLAPALSRPSTCSCARTRSPSSSTASGSPRPRAPSGRSARSGRRPRSGGRSSAPPTACPRRVPGPSGRGPSPAARRSAPGCRSSTAATRRAPTASCRSAAARSAAARSTTSSTRRAPWPLAGYREVTLLGQNVNSYGHDLAPEPRFAHVDAERWAGRRLDLHGRPDLAELIRAIDGAADRRRPAGHPAAALRDLAPVGPVRPAHRRPGRLPERLRAPAPAGPVGRRRGPAPDGPPVHDRALPRAARPDPRGRARDHRSRPTSSSGSAARPRRSSSATLRAARGRPLRPGLRRRLLAAARARRRRSSPTTSRPTSSAAGSTSCSRVQEAHRPRAERGVARPRGRGPRRRRDAASHARPRLRQAVPTRPAS